MFESPATLIISVDSEGIIVDCNPRVTRMMGYQPDEMVGQYLVDFVHEDYHALVQRSLNDVLEKGFDYDKQYKIIRKDGIEIDVNVNSASVKDENGEYVRTICMIDDMSERIQT
jgi:PAS domain S-box-containing protein